MNVLILTPDAVGSTLLQRMLTIYMQFHEFDRPVINLHELTNGLQKYYSPEFNQEIVSKHQLENWGYYQSLNEVVELLSSVTHYKTSRLAHYHLVRRGDALEQQIPFYNYLNKNFYVIACRRNNIFEHALSMTLNSVTKKLNVYNAHEKIETFFDLYRNGIELDMDVFIKQLNAYKKYIDWSEQYFEIGRYFNYEIDVVNLEKFILNLPVFANQSNLVTWDKNFGITFNEFNQTHYAMSDINAINFNSVDQLSLDAQLMTESSLLLEKYQQLAPSDWPNVHSYEDLINLPAEVKNNFYSNVVLPTNGLLPLLSHTRQNEIKPYLPGYHESVNTIDKMIELGIIMNGPPIKKQTLSEKRKIIKNFSQAIDLYNHWIELYPNLGTIITDDDINNQCHREQNFWKTVNHQSTKLLP